MTSRAEQIFFEVFEPLPRQGPGNFACAERALALCAALPISPRVLDLGCGSGEQTFHLASLTKGTIVAVDSHAPLIERLRAKVKKLGLSDRVEARVGDMSELDLLSDSFDLVWSEGALYNMGLTSALPMCADLIRPGGYLAFTEAVWRTTNAPPDVREAFADYATMGRVEDVLPIIQESGLSLVDNFDLPDDAWWDDFYSPMERQIEKLRVKYAGDAEALAALDEVAKEPAMHRHSGDHYGYTFFVVRRG